MIAAYLNTVTINPGANDDPPPVAVIGGRQMRLVKVDWLGRWVYRP